MSQCIAEKDCVSAAESAMGEPQRVYFGALACSGHNSAIHCSISVFMISW